MKKGWQGKENEDKGWRKVERKKEYIDKGWRKVERERRMKIKDEERSI